MEADYGQTASTLWGPRLVTRVLGCWDGVEISVHSLPKAAYREFAQVFRGRREDEDEAVDPTAASDLDLLAICLNQHARCDLNAVGDAVTAEQERLLNHCFRVSMEIIERIKACGHWADAIDPCSGLPVATRDASKVYSEVDGLGYKTVLASSGNCKILLHPEWGSAVYPGTIFTLAPRNVIQNLLELYPLLPDEFV
jgi:hypothetical protein